MSSDAHMTNGQPNTQPDSQPNSQFDWRPQPMGQALVNELLDAFLKKCPGATMLATRMQADTGTRFRDWVDTIFVPGSPVLHQRLIEAGFTQRPVPGAREHFVHLGAMFPAVVFEPGETRRVAIKVDFVADFLATWKLDHLIEGEPWSQFRRAKAFVGDHAELWVFERHGYRGFEIAKPDPARSIAAQRHLENFRKRRREFGDDHAADARGYEHAGTLADAAIRDLGRDWACELWFHAERDYWQRRCRAGRVQKARQDALGLGWANHDHHTYRSSRHCYTHLIAFLERFGFTCREKFYAGHEAFWGAQVIEQATAGITIFADVDMTPDELLGDFPHRGFSSEVPGGKLGTIGLWCSLHGEAFLQAGMHHLECQFDWFGLTEQLEREANVKMMDPFTTFPYLRQAFTEGERWPVAESRLRRVLSMGQITPAQAEEFRTTGAMGSHLENLERNDGFKGFNQQGVSDIIARTDPRKHAAVSGA